jgi:hypothetical protein|tara:strand:+ start:354 stop:515 length:162 start_codon:yes stop_codon:yes gene_type:complete
MKLIVCNECDGEFKINHAMGGVYRAEFCVFCGCELTEENKDEVEPPEWTDDDE